MYLQPLLLHFSFRFNQQLATNILEQNILFSLKKGITFMLKQHTDTTATTYYV